MPLVRKETRSSNSTRDPQIDIIASKARSII